MQLLISRSCSIPSRCAPGWWSAWSSACARFAGSKVVLQHGALGWRERLLGFVVWHAGHERRRRIDRERRQRREEITGERGALGVAGFEQVGCQQLHTLLEQPLFVQARAFVEAAAKALPGGAHIVARNLATTFDGEEIDERCQQPFRRAGALQLRV